MNQTNIVNRKLTGCVPSEIDFRNRFCIGNGGDAESSSILKGLRSRALCKEPLQSRLYPERVADLSTPRLSHNPFRVTPFSVAFSQGSEFLATLGFVSESLWDSSDMRSHSPLRNPW